MIRKTGFTHPAGFDGGIRRHARRPLATALGLLVLAATILVPTAPVHAKPLYHWTQVGVNGENEIVESYRVIHSGTVDCTKVVLEPGADPTPTGWVERPNPDTKKDGAFPVTVCEKHDNDDNPWDLVFKKRKDHEDAIVFVGDTGCRGS